MKRRTLVGSLAATAVAAPFVHANAQAPMTLNGAVQFNDDHAFNKARLTAIGNLSRTVAS